MTRGPSTKKSNGAISKVIISPYATDLKKQQEKECFGGEKSSFLQKSKT